MFFYFIKISKFALPGVKLMYERTSIDRKKERKRLEPAAPRSPVKHCATEPLRSHGDQVNTISLCDFYGLYRESQRLVVLTAARYGYRRTFGVVTDLPGAFFSFSFRGCYHIGTRNDRNSMAYK